jgi:class 3 adenylate cyclase/tetratricopeptide (TPR) repeat protein
VATEIRKTVTVLFSDIVGSTAMAASVDAESMREMMLRYFDEAQRVIERHGGTVEKFIGDAVMAVFGVPVLHEDDAMRAVLSAYEMNQAMDDLNDELERRWGVRVEQRIGVNTGEVVATEAGGLDRMVTGDTVNVAARLEQNAPPGEILLGHNTYQLVRQSVSAGAVTLSVKGKASPLRAWRLDEVTPYPARSQRHLDSPLIGRESDLAALEQAFEETRSAACRLATLVGAPGVGKSRLIELFLTSLAGRARVVRGGCLPYGEGVTYWAIGTVVKDLAGVDSTDTPEEARSKVASLLRDEGDDERARAVEVVASAIGLFDAAASTQEISWAVRRLLEEVARSGPLVIVLDDMQWADPALLDLVERLALTVTDVPLLLLCLARPELFEETPDWCEQVPHTVRLELEPLGRDDVLDLMSHLLEGEPLPPDLRDHVVAAAAGNPLFVEELLRMLVDDGIMIRTDRGWVTTADPGGVAIPPTVGAILAARLDRLTHGERAVAQHASVIGREFYRDALDEHAVATRNTGVADDLRSLVRKQMVAPLGVRFLGSDSFKFSHILAGDTAYASCPKAIRATLHEQVAGWLEERAGARATEYAEIIGYHLEQSVRHLHELGRRDAPAAQLSVRAGQWLALAGRHALLRDDMHAAVNLLERAAGLAPADEPNRGGLLRDLGTALVHRGRFDDADQVLADAAETATRSGQNALAELAGLDRQLIRLQTRPEGALADIERVTDVAFDTFTDLSDDLGLTRVWQLRGELHWMACSYGPTTTALERALTHARRANDGREQAAIAVWLASCLALGPAPVPSAIERCHELLRSSGSRRVEAAVYTVLGYLHALDGEPGRARVAVLRGKQRHDELGLTFARAHWSIFSGMALLFAGDVAAAEEELRWGYEKLRGMGERAGMSTVAAYLARVLVAEERYSEAERLTIESERHASSDDLASQIAWRCVRALCRVAAHDAGTASGLAESALELARATDDLELLGFAHTVLARSLEALGDQPDADVHRREAVAAYLAKGDVVGPATLTEAGSEPWGIR